ncbi:hypothetical protein [Streptomyces sp. CB03234]|uniref:hypothetical protein n=1 Tax=Streptomyces sp. (strain CB03234) TaxID=1703937 RepID=UPI001301149C|nr:hypothetical protein [Streptomyces sp. CB03234]
MGAQDQNEDSVTRPERPPLSAAQAREETAGLREAIKDVRRSEAAFAALLRDAHTARACIFAYYGLPYAKPSST